MAIQMWIVRNHNEQLLRQILHENFHANVFFMRLLNSSLAIYALVRRTADLVRSLKWDNLN